MLSKGELQAELRRRLEQCVRELTAVRGEKKAAVAGYNEQIEALGDTLDAILAELDGCGVQAALPLGEEELSSNR